MNQVFILAEYLKHTYNKHRLVFILYFCFFAFFFGGDLHNFLLLI